MQDNFQKEAELLTHNYGPNEDVQAAMKDYKLIIIAGLGHCGAHAVMATSSLPIVKTRTTAKLPEQIADMYEPIQSAAHKEQAIDDLRKKNFVYAATHPRTGTFSGVLMDDLLDGIRPQVAPVFPGQRKRLRESGMFGELLEVYVVPGNYEVWESRLPRQDPPPHKGLDYEYVYSRLDARATLEEAVADKELHFIINDELDIAARDLWGFARTGYSWLEMDREQNNRQFAARLLSRLANEPIVPAQGNVHAVDRLSV